LIGMQVMLENAARRLNRRFREQIPLAGQIGLEITGYDGRNLVMAAPLTPNRNDKGTGFAGSIATLATLAGWALITLWVEERLGLADVAVFHSEITYRRPITGDFFARCRLPDEERLESLLASLNSKGRGRLELSVVVCQGETEAVFFRGAYAVRLRTGK
jgi:thioesterase domain-containing protein